MENVFLLIDISHVHNCPTETWSHGVAYFHDADQHISNGQYEY